MIHIQPSISGVKPSIVIRSGKALSVFLEHVSEKTSFICDLGCGEGTFLKQLAERGFTNLCGVEVNAYGRTEFMVKTSDLSYEPLPFPDETLDYVTAWEVFEHLENPYQLIREAHRVLKPGKLLMLSTPNIFHIRNRMRFLRKGDFIRWTAKNDHRTYFTNKVFQKSFLKLFYLEERRFCVPSFTQTPVKDSKDFRKNFSQEFKRFVNRFLPENEWFGYLVVYVLRKK